MLKMLMKWWNKPGDDLCSAMDFAFEAGAKAARKECAALVRAEALHWKAQGQEDTRDFEICALLIERSNAGVTGSGEKI